MPLLKKNLLDLVTFNRGSSAMRTNGSGVGEVLPANVPRIDYDPVTLQPLGLLVERYSINKARYSHQMDKLLSAGGAWGIGSNSTFIGTCNAPQGTGYIYQGNGSRGNEFVAQNNLLAANTNYVVSILAKLVSGALPTSGAIIAAEYTRADGSIARQNLPFSALTTEWKKHYVTFLNSTERQCTAFLIADQDTTAQIAIAGFKIEEGTIPTSDIVTGATQVARAADNTIIQGKNFTDIWNPKEGTFIVEFDINALGQKSWPGVFSVDLDWQNCLHVYVDDYGTDKLLFEIFNAAGGFTTGAQAWGFISEAAVIPNKKYKFSISYSAAGVTVCFGEKVTKTPLATGVLNFASFTKMKIGQNRGGEPLGGHISKFQYIGREFKDSEHLAAIA